jgi:hypothetical protein
MDRLVQILRSANSRFAGLLMGVALALAAEARAGDCCNPCGSSCCDCLWCRDTLFSWESCFNVREEQEDPNEEKEFALDRPDFVEASSTIGLGYVAIESGYTYTFNNDNDVQTISHSYPEALFRIGILAEWFELRIGQNYAEEQERSGGVTTNVSGAEDLYLGIKLALTKQAEWLPESAVILQMTVPTGDADFTDDEVLPGINYCYSWGLGDYWDMGGSTQGNRAIDVTGGDYLEMSQAWAFGYAVADDARVYVEWFSFLPHGADVAKPEHYGDMGLSWFLTPNFEVDARFGIGLNEAADDYFTGMGGGIRF